MATKSLNSALITLVVENLHRDQKDFYASPLRDEVVATMPSADKKAEYASLVARKAQLETALPGDANKVLRENTIATVEAQIVAMVKTWFKGTVFDACYSVLKKARARGVAQYEAALAELKRNATGAPEDTLGRDVRAIFVEENGVTDDAAIRAKIRALLVAEKSANTPPVSAPAPAGAGADTRSHGRGK